MKILVSGRGGGKTTKLIDESANTGAYIVTLNRQRANQIQDEARAHGLSIPLPISFDEFLHRQYYGKGIKGFLIDDAEQVLYRLCPVVPIDMIALNGEVLVPPFFLRRPWA
jgi:hypothetical protein